MEVLRGQQVEPLDRPLELPLPARPRRLLEHHARLLRQQPQRPAEVDLLDVLDEGEVVATLLAAVAMPQLLLRRYIEGWGLLRVEGAESLQIAPGFLQSQVFRDQVGQVQAILDLLDGVLLHRWHRRKLTRGPQTIGRPPMLPVRRSKCMMSLSPA